MSDMLIVSGSPHIHTPLTTRRTMCHVLIALLPAWFVGVWQFGAGALMVTLTSVAGCMAVEWIVTRLMLRRSCSLGDGSAIVTGLLLAMNLPSNLPWWTVLIGCVAAVGIGKMAFGGLGCNIFNPALVGRVFLLLSFPVLLTSWPLPGEGFMTYTDASTGATPLAVVKEALDMPLPSLAGELVGATGGSFGEVGAAALLAGFVYLLAVRVITWHIPVAIFATVALMAATIGGNVVFELTAGGLILGAVFMATDYVTSPMTPMGMIIYGVLIGAVTVIIRHWGAYPEGVSFAILLGNGVTPLLNRWCKPRRFAPERRVAR